MNIRVVVKVLGFLMLVTAGCLLVPALVSLLYRENDWIWFLASAGIGAVVGAVIGAALAAHLSNAVLRRIFALFLLVVGVRMLLPTRPAEKSSNRPPLSSPLSSAQTAQKPGSTHD